MGRIKEGATGLVGGRWPIARLGSSESGNVTLTTTHPPALERRARRAHSKTIEEKTISTNTLRQMNLRVATQTAVLGAGIYATGRAGFWAVEKAVTDWSSGNRATAYAEVIALLAPPTVKRLYRGTKKQIVKTVELLSEDLAVSSLERSAKKTKKVADKHPKAAGIYFNKHKDDE